jgi:hypothetical protein
LTLASSSAKTIFKDDVIKNTIDKTQIMLSNTNIAIVEKIDTLDLNAFSLRKLFMESFEHFFNDKIEDFLATTENILIAFLRSHEGKVINSTIDEMLKNYATWHSVFIDNNISIGDAKIYLWCLYKSLIQFPAEDDWKNVTKNSEDLKTYILGILPPIVSEIAYTKQDELDPVELHKTENKNHACRNIIQFISNEISTSENESSHETIARLKKTLSENPVLLFYPSSGLDIDDIEKLTHKNLLPYTSSIPNVFIHVDADCYCIHKSHYNYVGSFQVITDSIIDIEDDEKRIEIYQLFSEVENRNIWLIQFGGYRNEELLKFFLQNRVPITFLYSFIDGSTTGMGGVEYSLSTTYYAFFYDLLSVKYVVTEYSKEFVREFNNEYQIQQNDIARNLLMSENYEYENNAIAQINNKTLFEQTNQYPEIYPNNDLTFKTHISYGTNGVLIRYCSENAKKEINNLKLNDIIKLSI